MVLNLGYSNFPENKRKFVRIKLHVLMCVGRIECRCNFPSKLSFLSEPVGAIMLQSAHTCKLHYFMNVGEWGIAE